MSPMLSPLPRLSFGHFLTLVLMLATWSLEGAGRQLSGPHAPASSQPVPPLLAPSTFTVPEGFEMRLFASEPEVVNPVAMDWDERGRLWVLELFEYPEGARRASDLEIGLGF
ncbi:MAG: hypothetical protein EBU26_06485 [Verrucomicrobia bacterium]|nr:hypothetical protein [Verrucomicrobiota bacterium]